MNRWIVRALQRWRWRITHTRKFPKADLLSSLLNLEERGFRPQAVLDIGANKAKWSRRVKLVFPEAHVLMIEPQEEMRPYLDRFCRRHSGCRWLLAGCGNRVGTATLTVCPDTVSTSFAIEAQVAAREGWERREVPITTVDALVAQGETPLPDILKIDAEGLEREILEGARSVLGKTELVFVEAHLFGDSDHPSSLLSLTRYMEELGYAPYDFTWFGKRPYDGAIGLSEVAFARRDGQLRAFRGWSRAA